MKRPTCKINNSKCPLHHLSLDTCDAEKAICLPCEEMDDSGLENLKDRIEEHRTEHGIDF